jgi:hypothetical protein
MVRGAASAMPGGGIGAKAFEGLFLMPMKTAIDDLPSVRVSRLRALGDITAEMKVTTVRFGEVEFNVALSMVRFPNGGSWSFFVCPCGRRCRTLRLYGGGLACHSCLKARGLRNRVELFSHASKRTAYTAPRRLARLNSSSPARLHPRPGRMLDGRARLELAFKRSLIVERRAAVEQFEKDAGEL